MSRKIQQALGLVDPNRLNSDEEILVSLSYDMLPEKKVLLIKKWDYLVVSTFFYSKIKKTECFSQSEYPLASLPWIIDRIENDFRKKPEESGFSNIERSVSAEFAGEVISVNLVMHCCAENHSGYSIWNNNRKSYISDMTPQKWDIPTSMLKEGLLDVLKKIAAAYC